MGAAASLGRHRRVCAGKAARWSGEVRHVTARHAGRSAAISAAGGGRLLPVRAGRGLQRWQAGEQALPPLRRGTPRPGCGLRSLFGSPTPSAALSAAQARPVTRFSPPRRAPQLRVR